MDIPRNHPNYWICKGKVLPHPLQELLRLTGLVDSRIVAEFQHVEVSSLHTAPDAVNPRDVGAFVVHLVQRPYKLVIAVVAKGHGGNQLEEKEKVEGD